MVIDHHLSEEGMPASVDIIINLHMLPSAYGFSDYYSAGSTYKLAYHMLQGVDVSTHLSNGLLVLTDIGTIVNSIPLVQSNRSLATRALGVISTYLGLVSPGLPSLLIECGTPNVITAYTSSYKLVPLVNTPGRVYGAGGSSSPEVFVYEDPEPGAAYVTRVIAINQRCKQVMSDYIEQACREAQN